MIAKIKGRLQKTKRNTPPTRYDLQNIADKYRITVKNKFQELELEDKDPEEYGRT